MNKYLVNAFSIFIKFEFFNYRFTIYVKSLLVLIALIACVFAETQDQETAEQYFLRYGYYPVLFIYLILFISLTIY